MSYVVCSNTTREENQTTGNKQPNTFTNNFKSPLIIEPNSEVAVESVKINRQAEYDGGLLRNNRRFFIYYGPEQDDGAGVKSGDVTKTGVEINLNDLGDSVGPRGLAVHLAQALNRAPLSPNIFGKCNVTLNRGAANEWEGFNYEFNQRDTPVDTKTAFNRIEDAELGNTGSIYRARLDSAIPFPAAGAKEVPAIEWDNVGLKWECKKDNKATFTEQGSWAFSRLTKPVPLSPIGGECVFHLNAPADPYASSWAVGVTRPATTFFNGGLPPQMPRATINSRESYRGGIDLVYMDYALTYDVDEDILILEEFCAHPDGTWDKRNIEYWGAVQGMAGGFSNQAKKADLSMAGYNYVVFKLVGNEVRVAVSTGMPGGEKWLTNTALFGITDKDNNLKPTNNSTEWLLPGCALWKDDQEVTLTKWEGIALYNAGEVNDLVARKPDVNQKLYRSNIPVSDNDPRVTYIPGSDWCSSLVNKDPRDVRHEDQRWSQLQKSMTSIPYIPTHDRNGVPVAQVTDFTYSGLDAGGDYENYKIVFVVGEEYVSNDEPLPTNGSEWNIAIQALYNMPQPNKPANMSQALGFGPSYNILKTSVFGVEDVGPPYKVTFSSFEAGVFNVQAAFVRVNDLTLRSFNGATNSRSQILYHLPKFTNEGRQFGELYFAPNEKTYIKLHNSRRETINQLSLDIVNRSEQVVEDFTGNTIVVLHIRQSDSKMEEHSCC